ncbi:MULTISPECIES: hypothetical protein [unclassified Sphingopyxis]|uniref:hypothetical protein n=1 Tax=unclassified Sphingopyxis TaxID=2614943 RepID=UPI000AB7138A|nr:MULTISPECIES: hypothetical protein [unclassified Sphingopyxis]
MKTIFAQATTFALSAAGALAILVGVIDQPKVAFDIAASPGGMALAAAATTPAVGQMA